MQNFMEKNVKNLMILLVEKEYLKKIIHFIANAEDVKVILYLKQSITV